MNNKLWGNIVLIIYCLFWTYVFIKQKRQTKDFGPCLFVILTYCVYSFLSLALFNLGYGGLDWEITLIPMLFLFAMLWISLQPGMIYERNNVRRIQQPSMILIQSFIAAYGICTLFTVAGGIHNLQDGVMRLMSDSSSGTEMYLNARENATQIDRSFSGITGFAATLHNFLQDVSVFILFYYLSLKERKKSVYIYLLIVLIVDIMSSITEGGRTSFMMILLITLLAYFMFRDYWDEKTRQLSKRIIMILLILMTIPFIGLTISRFANKDGTINSIIYYAGSANLNFNDSAWNAGGIRYGDRTFNEAKRLMGFDVPDNIAGTRFKYAALAIDDSVFYTFVGDFVLDFGKLPTLLLFIFCSVVFIQLTKSNSESIPFHRLLLVYFTLCICVQGGMYLFYYSFQRFWKIVAFFLMYIVFYADYSWQKEDYRYLEKHLTDTKTNMDEQ